MLPFIFFILKNNNCLEIEIIKYAQHNLKTAQYQSRKFKKQPVIFKKLSLDHSWTKQGHVSSAEYLVNNANDITVVQSV